VCLLLAQGEHSEKAIEDYLEMVQDNFAIPKVDPISKKVEILKETLGQLD